MHVILQQSALGLQGSPGVRAEPHQACGVQKQLPGKTHGGASLQGMMIPECWPELLRAEPTRGGPGPRATEGAAGFWSLRT